MFSKLGVDLLKTAKNAADSNVKDGISTLGSTIDKGTSLVGDVLESGKNITDDAIHGISTSIDSVGGVLLLGGSKVEDIKKEISSFSDKKTLDFKEDFLKNTNLTEELFNQAMGEVDNLSGIAKEKFISNVDGKTTLNVGKRALKEALKPIVAAQLLSIGVLNLLEEKAADMLQDFLVELIVFAILGHLLESVGIGTELLDIVQTLLDISDFMEIMDGLSSAINSLSQADTIK